MRDTGDGYVGPDPFDEYLDVVFSTALWDTTLISSLTSMGEDLEAWREDTTRDPEHMASLFAGRLTRLLRRLEILYDAIVDGVQAEEDGPPGADMFLAWAASSFGEARVHLMEAHEIGRDTAVWDDVGAHLAASLYFTVTAISLIGNFGDLPDTRISSPV